MTIRYLHQGWVPDSGRKRNGTRVSGMTLTGRHVLIAFLGFFGVIFAVNGVFLYYAIGSYTGVVANEPYRKGLEYNRRIADDARQAALGWTRALTLTRAGELKFALKDAAGEPITGLIIEAQVGRPSTNVEDATVRLIEGAPGVYQSNLGAMAAGAWLVSAEAVRRREGQSDEVVYRVKERIWLKPS